MPLTRYQIRNEFNLADPDLYRAADRDDPEALLEGVAMAGLVGLLRQLGDLAEFAAEIFHDLHEEVMATAARGHGLMARIQQLEADVPLIEKNLLSRTNHTAFYYNTGVDWHPQMCTDQNLITQGDMPRFIRDSYEECRGPPQLFLLDKFDIGGAGACLKRYTDPSSFKSETTTSDATKLGVQRDRRNRKIKKKGSHWRHGDTPEILTTSHAKLHQLLLEERIGNDCKDSTRHVKLKKRILDGSKSGSSYMEKFLQAMSPEHSDEIEVGHPVLRLTYNQSDASEHEILDIQPVSATEDSHYLSHTGQEMKLRPSAMYSYDFSKSRRNRGSSASIEDGSSVGTASPLRITVTENELGIDGDDRNGNGNVSPYYDATANGTEHYVDALAHMESEAETDDEYIPKKEQRYFSNHAGVYDSKEQIMDSQSVDNSIISDDGSISFMKGTSTSSSHGALPNDREAESSLSMKTYDAVVVDYSDSFDYGETEKTLSNRYLNAGGETVGSIATLNNHNVGDISFQKDSSHLLQSSNSGLCSSQLTPDGAYYTLSPTEEIYDPEHPQVERKRANGGAVTTPDDPFKVDDLFVKSASIERHESEVPSEVCTHSSKDLSHDHSKLSSMIENVTLQKGHVDDFLTENIANEDVESSQSASDTELQDFEEGYQNGDGCSHLIASADDKMDSYHVIVSKDENARPATGDILDGYNHVMDSTAEKIENIVAASLEIHAYANGGLDTTERELAATESISEIRDTEDHLSSNELLFQMVPENIAALESDSGQVVLPATICSLSGNRNSDEAVTYQTDTIAQQFGDLQTEIEVNFEGAPPLPPLPPMQWMAGKPQDSYFDAEGESGELSMPSNGSLLPSAFGLKSSFNFTPLDGEIMQLLKATETDGSSQNASSHHPGGFPLSTDSSSQVKDAIEERGEKGLLMSDKLISDSSIIKQRTNLESGQPDTLGFAKETPESSSGSCFPSSPTNSDAFRIEAVNSSHAAQSSVPLIGDMTTDTKQIIQPRPAETVVSARETIQSSAMWESPRPPLGLLSELNASEVPMLSADQSLDVAASCSRTVHETQSVEEKIIKSPEVCGPLSKDEEHHKQETRSKERQASWSLALLNYEGEKLAEKPAVKPPRPRNPLIESVDALDRSKLKKVTPQNRPKAPAADERGSLLEQIRAKSFNLKPAPAPVLKPIMRAPTMNLKVAAILEKANKIRRATAGSDEDDEDEWSDD